MWSDNLPCCIIAYMWKYFLSPPLVINSNASSNRSGRLFKVDFVNGMYLNCKWLSGGGVKNRLKCWCEPCIRPTELISYLKYICSRLWCFDQCQIYVMVVVAESTMRLSGKGVIEMLRKVHRNASVVIIVALNNVKYVANNIKRNILLLITTKKVIQGFI